MQFHIFPDMKVHFLHHKCVQNPTENHVQSLIQSMTTYDKH